MIFLWGKGGIVPFLITVSAMTILTSWWYARKIPVTHIIFGWRETLREAKDLLSLGLVFMSTGLMTTAVTYLVRVLVVRRLGMDDVGLYQAASTLSSLYIGVILGAMGMDFYPRLTAVAEDNDACNQMVNEQTEVGLLIAAPGILATLTFAPLVIHIFYSASSSPHMSVALADNGNIPSGGFLADGLRSLGKRKREDLFLDRVGGKLYPSVARVDRHCIFRT